MKEQIQKALKQIESEHDCRILFAVESGSRAWGFASPDSDYDIRAVYVKPLDWYLGLEERQSDTINAMLPDDIDVAAWELRGNFARRSANCSRATHLSWNGWAVRSCTTTADSSHSFAKWRAVSSTR